MIDRVDLKQFIIENERKILWLKKKLSNSSNADQCINCEFSSDENDELMRCETGNCVVKYQIIWMKFLMKIFFKWNQKGVYCVNCYYELFQTCKLCLKQLDDDSDFSDNELESFSLNSSDDSENQSIQLESIDRRTLKDEKKTFIEIKNESKTCEKPVIHLEKSRITHYAKTMLKNLYEEVEEHVNQDYFMERFRKCFRDNENQLCENTYDSKNVSSFIIEKFLDEVCLEDYFDLNLINNDEFLKQNY